jgi:hypothetical protein
MCYDKWVTLACTLPGVEEGLYYRQPTIKRDGRFMFALKSSGEEVVVKLPWELRDNLLESEPEKYFITAHYEGWPYLLARIAELTDQDVEMLITASFTDAPKKQKLRKDRVRPNSTSH